MHGYRLTKPPVSLFYTNAPCCVFRLLSKGSSDSDAAAGVAWIAGVGASAGLGAALARRFAKGRLIVALTGRNAERVRAVAGEIAAAGREARAPSVADCSS